MQKAIKKLPASVNKRTGPMAAAAAVLLAAGIFMQTKIDPISHQIHKAEQGFDQVSGGLNNEFMLLPLLGFREAAAGLLWVRCDEFFHSGDYDAILPLVRVITLLDPHAENVYVTGAWHLSYNFTDQNERSDRRYIPPSQALLDEGIKNNPAIPDIKFEKGWQNFDKIKNYTEAEKALQDCIAGPFGNGMGVKDGEDYPYACPLKTLHLLAHTYEKQGRLPEALQEWKNARERTEKIMKEDEKAGKPLNYSNRQMWFAEVHNYDEDLQRYHNRYTTVKHDAINPSNPPQPGVLWPTGPGLAPQPWDVVFTPEIEVKRPKVLRVHGRFNSADGARVDVRITDWNFPERPLVDIKNSFRVDMSQTILMDSMAVRKGAFDRELDMSKDPKMYSFSQPEYKIVLSYNPRTTSPHLTDRFGWSGEGITDGNKNHVYMDTREPLLGTALIAGQGATGPVWDGVTVPWSEHTQPVRMIMVTYKVTRAQIMGERPITDADIVPNQL
jgi:tetratricopeptide (TPR) repeat protein